MDITADPFFPAPLVFFTGLFGAALMAVLWRQSATEQLVPSTHRAYLLASFSSLFGVGDGLSRLGFNPYNLATYLTWMAFVPLCATLLYFSAMSFNKIAYGLHHNKVSLFRRAMRIVGVARFAAICGFVYVIASEVFDWIEVGFDGSVIVAAMVGSLVSLVVLDMMYHDDWNEYAMTELEGNSN